MLSLFLTIPLTFVSIIGPVLNGCVVIAILLTRQVSSVNHILLLHLGILNLILGVLFLIFSVPSFTIDNWITSAPLCTFYGFFFTLFHPLVVWTICGLNCDRYYAIASPLHYGHIVSRKKVFLGLSTGWVISLALCIPPILKVVPYGYIHGLTSCNAQKYERGVLMYSAVYTICTLLIPATLIICCNLKILMIARYHRHRIASAIYEVTISAQVTITHQRNPFFVPTITAPTSGGPPKFKGKSAVHTVFQLLGSFLVFYLPYYVLVIWQALAGSLVTKSKEIVQVHPYLFPLATTLLIFSIPVNGFLYGVKNQTLRKTFQNYLRKKQTKSEIIQEIQARTPSTCGSRRPSLTPLGFFTRPIIQRRLSEAIIDVHNITSPQKSRIKRIASDIAWRPYSNSSLNISAKDELNSNIKQTVSCNTLQVPPVELDSNVPVVKEETAVVSLKQTTAHLIFQKIFNENQEKLVKKAGVVKNVLDSKSPRILITRAFSEESDKSNHQHTQTPKEILKKHSSSSGNLLEKKWKQIRYKYEEPDDVGIDSKCNQTTKPLLDNSYSCNSDSSETSDTSSCKLFMSLDNRKCIDEEPNEEHLLLSWPLQKKFNVEDIRRKKLKSLVNVPSHEIVL